MLKAGQIVKSAAGHDKDKFHVIVEVKPDRVLIADGRERKLAKPKAKNPLHVRPTNTVLDMDEIVTDKKLRNALARFCGGNTEEGGN